MRDIGIRDIPRAWRWLREGRRLAESMGLTGNRATLFAQAYADEKLFDLQSARRLEELVAKSEGRKAARRNHDAT